MSLPLTHRETRVYESDLYMRNPHNIFMHRIYKAKLSHMNMLFYTSRYSGTSLNSRMYDSKVDE